MSDDKIQPRRRPRRPEDEYQDEPPRRRPRREEEEDPDDDRRGGGGVNTLIPYKNPQALISYYTGVFSLIPCAGLLLGPTALVLGILGLRYKQKYPTAGGTAHAIVGIVLGTITTLGNWGLLLFGGLAAIFGR